MKHLKLFESNTPSSKFIAVLHQDGGCDYTIECGTTVIELSSVELWSAEDELSKLIEEEFTGDRKIHEATIYEISDEYEVDLAEVYRNIANRKKSKKDAEQEAKDREEFERLRKKFN